MTSPRQTADVFTEIHNVGLGSKEEAENQENKQPGTPLIENQGTI